jgi:diguanylate cyclase (GGDEF)-like protein
MKPWRWKCSAQREGTSLALLMIDIDYFKLYNDTYGHVAGDACLREVSHVLQACVRRAGDLVARYGGEEIGVILPNTERDGAEAVARHVLERLSQRNISIAPAPLGRLP